MEPKRDLFKGSSNSLLLCLLEQQPMYGYQIAKLIEVQTKDVDIMKQGALYPVLRSLEATGLLESEVEPSVAGPPRRYYRITAAGRQTLAKWIEIWHQTRELVDAVIKGGDDD